MVDIADVAERVWYGRGVAAAIARGALAPASLAFGAIVRARAALYDAGVLSSHDLALPALGVGNLTVGGTGKTPVSAWFATQLQRRGARPAIVMRGYGDDEPLVHALLAPGVEVVADADRVRGASEAKRRGADVIVLDDAFQHRRARRAIDVVLVSAERAERGVWMLPAGPYREPPSALRRASAVVVTRKSASPDAAESVRAWAERIAPGVATAIVALRLESLHAWGDQRGDLARPLSSLDGARVLAVAGVGDPGAFFDQLRGAGARVDAAPFADHHRFMEADVASLVRRAEHADRVVCTLKDAVKLGPAWPPLAPALWYVSQRVAVERGGDVLDELIARLLRARHNATTGSGRPS